jgi:hypothetical protein
MNKKLNEIKTRHAQRTPGPYMWDVSTAYKKVSLISATGNFIMKFIRWGTNSAAPAFRSEDGGLVRVEHFTEYHMTPGYVPRMYINNPDAIGLEKSWEDVEELLKLVDRLRYALEAVERQVKDPCNRGAKTLYQQCRLMDYIWEEILKPTLEEVRGSGKGEVK